MANFFVASKAGTVGKSTISSVVIAPRLGCDEVIAIETENAAGARYAQKVKRFSAERYGSYMEYVIEATDEGKNTVTDLGASNYVPFVRNLALGNTIAFFDYLVVVTDTQERSQQDAIETILHFLKLGMDLERVRIVLNKSRPAITELTIEQQYETVFAAARVDPRINVNPECNMPDLPIFDQMAFNNISWSELLADTTDHTARLKATVSDGQTMARAKTAAYRMAQASLKPTIMFSDLLFKALNIGPVIPAPALPTVKQSGAAAAEESRNEAGKHPSTDKLSTVKA
ncbi:hypothetical protein OKW41_000322 [Paraburkholderia sp. UCT70]|uniref:hypothetical protein n=1 Tax=Paraburkholderia sp. UCT70 TaxID=2991068 RepID=UPI003D196E6C